MKYSIPNTKYSSTKLRAGKIINTSNSFTLVELLVVIGILAVLTAAVVVIINPAEYLRSSRDAKRMSDLSSIDKALSVLETQGITDFGIANRVYVSIPDSNSSCTNLGLPTLPSPYQYICSSSNDYTKINGTGWIPVNFQASSALSFSNLPTDPTNSTTTSYYTYTPGGSWEMNTFLESKKYRLSGDKDRTSTDGGDSYAVYEAGSNKALSPFSDSGLVGYWKFDGDANDYSGGANNGTAVGSPTYATGKVGQTISLSGSGQYVTVPHSASFNFTNNFSFSYWVYVDSIARTNTVFRKWVSGLEAKQSYVYDPTGQYSLYLLGPSVNLISVNPVLTGGWYFVAGTYNGSSGTVYTNGVFDKSVAMSGSITNNTRTLYIGRDAENTSIDFGGKIDELRMYSRALSAAEIGAIYEATK